MFGVCFQVIGSKVEERLVFSRFWPKNRWTNPLGIWSKFQIYSNFLHS